MKGFIKVTSIRGNKCIYINVNHIGDFSEIEETISYGRVDKPKHTNIGVTTHNNGGFSVEEDIQKIIELIEEARN